MEKRKGFTLIELLMVIAIIGTLATIILISLNSSREKATVAKYTSYATQMHRLVADTVAAGYLDRSAIGTIADGRRFCLGEYPICGGNAASIAAGTASGDALTIRQSLTKLTELPPTFEYSPYSTSQEGVFMEMNQGSGYVRVYMYLLDGDSLFLQKTCDSMNWAVNNGYCYADVSLNARM